MEAYKQAEALDDGSVLEFWTQWWNVLDFILPELLPWERGVFYGHKYDAILRRKDVLDEKLVKAVEEESAKRQKAVLSGTEDEGMDFLDAIRRHLAHWLPSRGD